MSFEIPKNRLNSIPSLREDDIKVGTVLMFDNGRFPGKIIEVDENKRFRIHSYETWADQEINWYSVDENSPDQPVSGKGMRIASFDEVYEYMDRREKELQRGIETAKQSVLDAERRLKEFRTGRAKLYGDK